MEFEAISYEKNDGIGRITLDRPEVFNAYNEAMSLELKKLVEGIGEDSEVRVVVVKGSGENFMAGADITMLNHWSRVADEDGWEAVKKILDNHFSPSLFEKLPQPVIAAVDGMAWGMGSEISLGCDMRICTTRASFSQPEINLGIITGSGASQRLPRIIGKACAMQMILTGSPIKAEKALQWGLVNEVVQPEDLDRTVEKIAGKIIAKSPLMVKWAKQCVNLVDDHDLYQGIDKELSQFSRTFATEDAKEGTAAFLEKRSPNFQGK